MGSTELKQLVDQLIDFDLNKGVTPLELATNIYEEGYNEIRISKQTGSIHCIVQFNDNEYFLENETKIKYRYIYDLNNYLLEVHCIKNKTVKLLWSRAEERARILTSIHVLAKCNNISINNFIYSPLTHNLRKEIEQLLQA